MSLDGLRTKIDAVDARIVGLLNRRFRLAAGTARHKTRVRDVARERDVLFKVRSLARPPADPEALAGIYRTIFAESRRLQLREKEKEHENRHPRRGKDGSLAGPGAGRARAGRRLRRPQG